MAGRKFYSIPESLDPNSLIADSVRPYRPTRDELITALRVMGRYLPKATDRLYMNSEEVGEIEWAEDILERGKLSQ